MKTIMRLVSAVLALALSSAPAFAQAGKHVARAAHVSGAPAVVAPIVIPALGAAAGGLTRLPDLGVQASALDLPNAAAAGQAADASLALGAQPAAAAAASGAAVAAAAPEAEAAQAVRSFQAAVAPRANGERVSRLASSLLGWLKPKAVHSPVAGNIRPLAPLPASTGPDEERAGSAQPPRPPLDGGQGPGRSHAWRDAVLFISGLVVAQVGVEAWGASWAKWVQTNYGIGAYTTITMIGLVVSLAAGYVGGWAADKFGVKKTYIAATILFAASAAATLALFQAGGKELLTVPLLTALAAVRTFVGSAGRTAEQTIPIAIFKDDKGALAKFNSVSQFILEIAGIGVPFMIGTLLGAFGSVGTMTLLPITAVLAAGVFLFVKMGEVRKNKNFVGPAEPDPKVLRIGMMAYPAVALLNFLMYAIVAIGYGNFVHPGATPAEQAAAAGVAGKIVALYSAGGMIAAGILSGIPGQLFGWLRRKLPKLDRMTPRRLAPEGGEAASELRSASKWLLLSAAGLASFVPMIWTNPLPAALAMVPFGVTNIMSTLQLMTLVQKNAPLEKKGKIMGGLRTITTLLSTAGLFGFSWLFKHYPGSPLPFLVLLGVLAVVGAYYVVMARLLARAALKK